MSIMIRLARAGTNKKPFYHIVACNKKSPRDGKYLERLGFYNPKDSIKGFSVNREAVERWVKKGAQVSETVGHLLQANTNSK